MQPSNIYAWNSPESLSGIETGYQKPEHQSQLPWNSPESLSGIETWWNEPIIIVLATWNSPESLSGIETLSPTNAEEVALHLGIPLNPYQGLKPYHVPPK
ncbi:MAG: hypothetical protein ACLGGO_17785 [Coleofasciculus sp.]